MHYFIQLCFLYSRAWLKCSVASSAWRSSRMHTFAHTAPSCVATSASVGGWQSRGHSAPIAEPTSICMNWSTAVGWKRSHSSWTHCSKLGSALLHQTQTKTSTLSSFFGLSIRNKYCILKTETVVVLQQTHKHADPVCHALVDKIFWTYLNFISRVADHSPLPDRDGQPYETRTAAKNSHLFTIWKSHPRLSITDWSDCVLWLYIHISEPEAE